MGNIIFGFLYDQLRNVMLGLLLFWILWRFYFCFEGFGWLVWLFKIAEQVSHFIFKKIFEYHTQKKKKSDQELLSVEVSCTIPLSVVWC